MKTRLLSVMVFSLALGAAAYAQDANTAPPAPQSGGNANGGYGQRGGRGGYGGMGMGMGGRRGLMGTVTEGAADSYKNKTEAGETYSVHFSVNTRIVKMPAGMRGPGGGGGGEGRSRVHHTAP